MPWPSDTRDLDAILAEFINCMYQEGDSLSQAGWLLSGLKRFVPYLKHQLPTSQQYYNNWLRDRVPQRAVPMPWSVLKALVGSAVTAGHWDLAVLLLLGFTFFLRSLEMIRLQRESVHFNVDSREVVVSLERTKTSKQFAQSIVLRRRGVARFLAAAWPKLPPAGAIWKFSPHLFRKCFVRLVDHANLTDCNFSLYSLRRGGATHVYTRTRDLHQVAIQGRWRDLSTARIYLDDARAVLLKFSFSPSQSQTLADLARSLSHFN
eukprot:Skav232004  [mRNA]  locus=scaffold719:653901:654689:- [translate_table: standard]